jgi:hypothetical protein
MLYARWHWRERFCRLLVDFLVIVCILSLGPVMHIAGRVVPSYLPWEVFTRFPVVNDVLAVRLSMYAFLDIAIIASLWFAVADTRLSFRLALAALVVVFTLPNLSAAFWVKMADVPAFFRNDAYRHYLSEGETVLILPYSDNGNCMLWQAQTDMYFTMPQGMAPPVRPYERRRWPIVTAFLAPSYIPEASQQLKAFLTAHHVNAVIILDRDAASWQPLFSTLNIAPIKVGGITLYRMSRDRADYADRTLLEMRARFDRERLYTLVAGVERYLSRGGEAGSLSAIKARDLNLIPRDSLFGPTVRFNASLAIHS